MCPSCVGKKGGPHGKGSDDYVGKRFNDPELGARIAALLRRARVHRERAVVQVGELRVDPASREVRLGDRLVELSAKEFAALHALVADPTRVFTKEELLHVWGFKLLGISRTGRMRLCTGGPVASIPLLEAAAWRCRQCIRAHYVAGPRKATVARRSPRARLGLEASQ